MIWVILALAGLLALVLAAHSAPTRPKGSPRPKRRPPK